MHDNSQIQTLISWANDKKKIYPKLEEDIDDFVSLAISEIETGGSVSHEIELCMTDIEDLIEENYN
jgi:hypothetical protein